MNTNSIVLHGAFLFNTKWQPGLCDSLSIFQNCFAWPYRCTERHTRRWEVWGKRAKWCVALPSPTPETHCHQERVCSSKLSAPASFWGVPLLWRLPADIRSQASAWLLASWPHSDYSAWNIDCVSRGVGAKRGKNRQVLEQIYHLCFNAWFFSLMCKVHPLPDLKLPHLPALRICLCPLGHKCSSLTWIILRKMNLIPPAYACYCSKRTQFYARAEALQWSYWRRTVSLTSQWPL